MWEFYVAATLALMPWWGWLLSAAAAILLGGVLWFTAFILWPASVVMIVVGLVKLLRAPRTGSGVPSDSNRGN
jgi:hypothetical protein